MNNDLEQFSEESLKELIEHINKMPDANGKTQFAALARIALAAKQAKPVGVFNQMAFDISGHAVVFSNKEAVEAGFLSERGELARNHQPLYTTPPSNSPAIHDGGHEK